MLTPDPIHGHKRWQIVLHAKRQKERERERESDRWLCDRDGLQVLVSAFGIVCALFWPKPFRFFPSSCIHTVYLAFLLCTLFRFLAKSWSRISHIKSEDPEGGASYSDYSLLVYGGLQTGYEKVSAYNGKSLRYTGNNKTNTKYQSANKDAKMHLNSSELWPQKDRVRGKKGFHSQRTSSEEVW